MQLFSLSMENMNASHKRYQKSMSMKPVPYPILAVAVVVGILLLSVTLPAAEDHAQDWQNTYDYTLPEPSAIDKGQELPIPEKTQSIQFPFLFPE